MKMPDYSTNFIIDYLSAINVKTIEFFGLTLNMAEIVEVCLILILTFIAVRWTPRLWAKISCMCIGIVTALVLLLAADFQLSWPKQLTPRGMQAFGEEGIQLLSMPVIKAPKYIFLSVDDHGVQRNFWVPWSKQTEEDIEKEKGEGGQKGDRKDGDVMYFRFVHSEENRPVPQFYFLPKRAPPLKRMEPPPRPFQFK
jgi:hypothetical protein